MTKESSTEPNTKPIYTEEDRKIMDEMAQAFVDNLNRNALEDQKGE